MGSFAPSVTTGIILLNVFVFILVTAFANDGTDIGTANNIYNELEASGDIDAADIKDVSFMGRFWLVFGDLPFWFNAFIIFCNVLLIPIAIFAWIRGL